MATVMQLSVSLPQQIPGAIGPVLTRDLGLTRAELGLLTTAIWGGMLLGLLPWGIFADRRGERWAVLLGGGILSASLLAAAQAPSFLPLFLILIVAAVGAAAASPGGTRALASWFEPARRGMAMGIRQTGVTAAGLVDALLLPPIALHLGWQAAFRTVAVLVLIGVGIFAVWYRDPPSAAAVRRQKFRIADLLTSRSWVAATAFGFVFMGALACSVSYLVAALHDDVGLSATQGGYLLGLLQVGGIAGRLGWGILSDRLRARGPVMAMAGALGVVSSLAMAGLAHHGASGLVLAGIALLLGLSCLGWNALYITLSAESVPEGFAATAVGAGTTLTFIGMFVAPVFGLIADQTGSYTRSWLALAGWAVIGTALALAVRDRA
jgi:MFS family permease